MASFFYIDTAMVDKKGRILIFEKPHRVDNLIPMVVNDVWNQKMSLFAMDQEIVFAILLGPVIWGVRSKGLNFQFYFMERNDFPVCGPVAQSPRHEKGSADIRLCGFESAYAFKNV